MTGSKLFFSCFFDFKNWGLLKKIKLWLKFCKRLKKQTTNSQQLLLKLSEKILKNCLIIGLGLIGGSFAKALRAYQISERICAHDLDLETLEQAIKSGAIDDFVMLDEDLSNFDFIVLASPLATYDKIAADIKNKIAKDAVVIDLGSVKEIAAKKKLGLNFIPCHPIAGSDKTGFENSSAEIFAEKKFIICPENCNETAVKKVTKIVEKIGAETEFLAAKKHDEIYALVSHLPQFLSFLTKDFSPKKITDPFFQTAFRLDNSSAEIWSDIFKLNEKNLEKFYLEFFDNLEKNIKSPDHLPLTTYRLPLTTYHSFEENFTAIFFRTLVVKSYLEISKIKTYESYAGSGFRDFTSIVAVLNFDQEKLAKILEKDRKKIAKLFEQLTTNS